MNAKDQLSQSLDRLAAGGHFDAGSELLQADTDSGHLECELLAVDALGCAMVRLTHKTDRLADASIDRLKSLGKSLAARLCYLLEPISPVEIDEQGAVVQLRSNPPHKEDQGTSYYELLVRRGQLSLCRYTKASRQPRHQVPAQLTREVLLRLAEDFTTAVE